MEEFSKRTRNKDGRDTRCKECKKLETKKWKEQTSYKPPSRAKYYLDNKEQILKKQKEYNKKPEVKCKNKAQYIEQRPYLNRYNISIDTYNKMQEEQLGKCAICEKESTKALSVDHCHETGEVRGLLCQPCNSGIGLLGDNLESLLKAVKYLRGKSC